MMITDIDLEFKISNAIINMFIEVNFHPQITNYCLLQMWINAFIHMSTRGIPKMKSLALLLLH